MPPPRHLLIGCPSALASFSFWVIYLLGLIESMNFINKQDGFPLAQPDFILCLFDDVPDIVDGCTGGRQSDKTSRALLFTAAGNNMG